MIKKVKTTDLRPGVFISDFNCDWQGEYVFIEQTLIKDSSIIDIILSWGIDEVYIDTDRGIDITAASSTGKKLSNAPRESVKKKAAPPTIPLKEEIKTATAITQEAIELVHESLQRVNAGKPPEIGQTYDLANKMKDSISRNRDALLLLSRIRKKDEYTLYHSISVSSLVLDMCSYTGVDDKQTLDLAVGALFHDIGKTMIPEEVLNKPGKLDEKEYREMKRHVEFSVELLRETRGLPMECFDIALHHHERYDGRGYPHGLSGENISFGSQLASICDVFDAITSERCYKGAIDSVVGLKKMYEWRGKHFKEDLTHDFIRCIGVYPVGSCVKMRGGWVGLVSGSTDNMLQPVVKVFYDERKKQQVRPFSLDLSKTDGVITSYGNADEYGLSAEVLLSEMTA